MPGSLAFLGKDSTKWPLSEMALPTDPSFLCEDPSSLLASKARLRPGEELGEKILFLCNEGDAEPSEALFFLIWLGFGSSPDIISFLSTGGKDINNASYKLIKYILWQTNKKQQLKDDIVQMCIE